MVRTALIDKQVSGVQDESSKDGLACACAWALALRSAFKRNFDPPTFIFTMFRPLTSSPQILVVVDIMRWLHGLSTSSLPL